MEGQKERKIDMFKPQDYAFKISTTTKAIFNIENDKFGFGVIADINFIKKNPFIAMTIVLGNFYNKMDDNSKVKIDDFIETYSWLMDKSIQELGEEKIKKIITEFNNIVATV